MKSLLARLQRLHESIAVGKIQKNAAFAAEFLFFIFMQYPRARLAYCPAWRFLSLFKAGQPESVAV